MQKRQRLAQKLDPGGHDERARQQPAGIVLHVGNRLGVGPQGAAQ